MLGALVESRQAWRHGYELAQLTGLRSGTLYPLLIRLETIGYLEAEWQPPAAPGRPPRHAYRLTAEGVARAVAERASRPLAQSRPGEALS